MGDLTSGAKVSAVGCCKLCTLKDPGLSGRAMAVVDGHWGFRVGPLERADHALLQPGGHREGNQLLGVDRGYSIH